MFQSTWIQMNFLFTLDVLHLVKCSIPTWYFMWWCQFHDWFKFEPNPSSLCISEMANVNHWLVCIYTIWPYISSDIISRGVLCMYKRLLHYLIEQMLDIWVIDQVWGQDGWILAKLFFCETESRSINTQKETRPISSHFDRTSLVNKGFIMWLSRRFSCGTRRVVPSGQDSSILPAWVANHSAGFGSSSPLTELAI